MITHPYRIYLRAGCLTEWHQPFDRPEQVTPAAESLIAALAEHLRMGSDPAVVTMRLVVGLRDDGVDETQVCTCRTLARADPEEMVRWYGTALKQLTTK